MLSPLKTNILLILIWLVITLPFMPSAEAAEWTTENTQWETAYMVTHIIDWGQTLEVARNPNYRELNQVLGTHPSVSEVNKYFILTSIGHYLISKSLSKYRLTWQKTSFFLKVGVVARNIEMGVKISF